MSADVDARLAAEPEGLTRLAPPEWRSGDIVWIVEAAGEEAVLAALLSQLGRGRLAGRDMRMWVMDRAGRPAVAAVRPALEQGTGA